MSDTNFGSWSVPESPVEIEYSLILIDEIRQVVTEGYQRLSRGGIEVGGVLYGTHDGRTVRVMAMREIACEHAYGPTFHLSDNDRAALTAQLERDREDSRLEGMLPVGWFLSHTRSEVTLQPSDLETYAKFFPEPWQVTMIVRPGRSGAMRAGFFVREPDGSVRSSQSYQEFNFPDRLAGILDRPPRERAMSLERPRPVYEPPAETVQAEPPVQAVQYDAPLFGQPAAAAIPQYAPYPDARRKWPWAIIALVIAIAVVAIVGLRFFGSRTAPQPISLAVVEHEGQLQIQWNHASSTIQNATRGSMEIVDGGEMNTLPLTAKDLAQGSLTYVRRSGDVQVRLIVTGSGGQQTEEASRFLGTPPETVDANEMDLLKVQRDALQDEVTRLRTQNGQQAARIQQLERTLVILQTRLGIPQNGR